MARASAHQQNTDDESSNDNSSNESETNVFFNIYWPEHLIWKDLGTNKEPFYIKLIEDDENSWQLIPRNNTNQHGERSRLIILVQLI